MTRLKSRRTLRLESLESRALLSGVGPTAQEQYMLELVNMARTKPAEMADWIKTHVDANDRATMAHYGVDLNTELAEIAGSTPTQPLAWNDTLGATAQVQSQYEADNQIQTHQGAGGSSLEQRLGQPVVDKNGNVLAPAYGDHVADGENSYAYANSVDHAMKAFLIDWGVSPKGHRGNLLQPNTPDDQVYNEVGIGIAATPADSQVGPFVMTQDFGRKANSQPQLVGVVYKDQDGDHMYSPNEGQGGVTIEVDDLNGEKVATTTTWGSGGYQIPLTKGTYNVTALVGDTVVQSQQVTVDDQNIKVDYDLSQPWKGGNLPSASVQAPATTMATFSNSNSNTSVVATPFTPSFDVAWLPIWTWNKNGAHGQG